MPDKTTKPATLLILLLLLNSCRNTDDSAFMAQVKFNEGWEFTLSADSSAAFNAESGLLWEKVRLPHTPVIEPLVVNNQ